MSLTFSSFLHAAPLILSCCICFISFVSVPAVSGFIVASRCIPLHLIFCLSFSLGRSATHQLLSSCAYLSVFLITHLSCSPPCVSMCTTCGIYSVYGTKCRDTKPFLTTVCTYACRCRGVCVCVCPRALTYLSGFPLSLSICDFHCAIFQVREFGLHFIRSIWAFASFGLCVCVCVLVCICVL